MYRANALYRFDQLIGKQYMQGHGPENTSEDEKRNRQIANLKMVNEILKKYVEMEKELRKSLPA
ncbi:hypothetical protein [Planococcus lenghuensis]|uniref:hypothetical protein n=1 Tax=Planococcus lenghuensis TaxID=2213202 RepID=UPI0012EB2434|nr:hypothetical protein [Planococcus lenghuensis]